MDLSTHSESEVAIAIIRCGCGAPDSHANGVCPTPRSTTDIGRVGYASNNRVKQALWDALGNHKANNRIREEAELNKRGN
jgi:hypothetical protein